MMNLTRTWFRRLITISLFCMAFLVMTASMPMLLAFLLVVDLPQKNGFAATRAAIFLFVYLLCEWAGILASFLIWVCSGKILGFGHIRFQEWNYRLQRWWAKTLFNSAKCLFGLQFEIQGIKGIRGPFILFVRHASLPDVILPSALFIVPKRMRIRHVMKKELLWDPCLDIVGNRIPNVFVDRGGLDSETEIRNLRGLMQNLSPNEGVMIYPEGTRFTETKRQRILTKLEKEGKLERLAQARQLKNVLPPRLGGTLALLQENREAAAVFCAHVGFERIKKAADFVNGTLIGAKIRIRLWSVPFDQIPKEADKQIQWFNQNWKRVDRWVQAERNKD